MQHDLDIANATRTAVRGDINDALKALATLQSGTAAPPSGAILAHSLWADTTAGIRRRRNAANTAWINDGPLAQSMVVARSSNTVLAIGDFAITVVATGTFTQTFDTAAALGSGWYVQYKNDGVGIVKLALSGGNVDVLPGKGCTVFGDGSTIRQFGLSGDKIHLTHFLPAAGDGTTDVRTALVAACTAARGRTLVLPRGELPLNTNAGSVVVEDIIFEGEAVLDGDNTVIDKGTTFLITGTTNSPFLVRRGFQSVGVGYDWPAQVDSATPTAYPFLLDFDFSAGPVQFVRFDHCIVYNAWQFCRMSDTAGNVGHCWFTNNAIYSIYKDFEIAHNLETIHVSNNHFTHGHWLAATEAGCAGYTRANGIFCEYKKGDGINFFDNLIFGKLRGLSGGAAGALVQFVKFYGNSWDQVRYPYYFTGAGNFYSIKCSGNDYNVFNPHNTALDGNALYMDNTGAGADFVSFTGDDFLQCTADTIYTTNSPGQRVINISGGAMLYPGNYKAAGNYHAANLNGGNDILKMTGVYLKGGYNAFTNGIGGSFNIAHLTGNTYEGFNNAYRSLAVSVLVHSGNVAVATQGSVSDLIAGAPINWSTGNYYDKPSGDSTKTFVVAKKNASQTIGAGPTDVTFATETADAGGNFASPTFTAPFNGRYAISWTLMHDNTGTAGDRFTLALVCSSAGSYIRSYKMIADYDTVSGGVNVKLAAGETVKLQITRSSGSGNFVTHNDPAANYLCIQYLD